MERKSTLSQAQYQRLRNLNIGTTLKKDPASNTNSGAAAVRCVHCDRRFKIKRLRHTCKLCLRTICYKCSVAGKTGRICTSCDVKNSCQDRGISLGQISGFIIMYRNRQLEICEGLKAAKEGLKSAENLSNSGDKANIVKLKRQKLKELLSGTGFVITVLVPDNRRINHWAMRTLVATDNGRLCLVNLNNKDIYYLRAVDEISSITVGTADGILHPEEDEKRRGRKSRVSSVIDGITGIFSRKSILKLQRDSAETDDSIPKIPKGSETVNMKTIDIHWEEDEKTKKPMYPFCSYIVIPTYSDISQLERARAGKSPARARSTRSVRLLSGSRQTRKGSKMTILEETNEEKDPIQTPLNESSTDTTKDGEPKQVASATVEEKSVLLDRVGVIDSLRSQRLKFLKYLGGVMRLRLQFTSDMATKVDWECKEHENMFNDIWTSLSPSVPYPGRKNEKWKDLGFQGADPQTDFRGCGMLGLRALHFWTTKNTESARSILSTQPSSVEHQYPVCTAVVALVAHLVTYLGVKGTMSKTESTILLNKLPLARVLCRESAHNESNPLHLFFELFSILMKFLDARWKEENATYFDFPRIVKGVQDELSTALDKNPFNLATLLKALHQRISISLVRSNARIEEKS